MCGIAGAIGVMDSELKEAVGRAHRQHRHRGPDAEGVVFATTREAGQGVALAHQRLAIIDTSEEANQPMIDEASGCHLIFNGEVYNFRELRRELEAQGIRFETASDTEVVLKAWVAWGEQAVERLHGMFAFAVWDPRQQALVLARDRLGLKPLYVAERPHKGGRVFLFASELRSLLATNLVERRLDPVGLESYLWNGFVTGPRTIVRGVSLLPSGHTLRVTTDGRAQGPKKYWSLPTAGGGPVERTRVADVVQCLRRSVQARLVSDVPLGVFLSGGIDSSAVAALAASSARERIRTFNVRFDEARFDESPYARRVADALGTDHRELTLSESFFEQHIPEALDSLDQPTFDAINTYFVSRAVREAGMTVALAGTGGDELFGGYRSFVDLPRARRAAALCSVVPENWIRAGARWVTRAKMGAPGAVPPQTRWGKLGDALSAGPDLLALYQVSYGLFTQEFLRELSDSGGTVPSARYGVPTERYGALGEEIRRQPALHAISMLETRLFLGERLLRDTDAASMASSLEVRLPLIDHQVVESAARLAPDDRFQPLGKKPILRACLDGLDPSLFERPKSGFELPLQVWCRQRLSGRLAECLTSAERCRRVGLRVDATTQLWQAFRAGAPGLYWSRVWSLFVLLEWCERYGIQR